MPAHVVASASFTTGGWVLTMIQAEVDLGSLLGTSLKAHSKSGLGNLTPEEKPVE